MSSSALVHLSTPHAAALRGDLDSGNKLTHLHAFFDVGNIVSLAMLQALFQHVAVLTQRQNLMLFLPVVALDQNVDLVTQ